MKVNKTQGVLFIYTILLERKSFTKEEIINYLEINELTFYRYIQELRAFFCNFNCEQELIYKKSDFKYYLLDMSNDQ
ncbi:MAG: hypothetical protein J1F31_03125 [Erysipelotrichales bacterium]|nr:hypothetical protein [Erysipelotrichales bacterium]